MPNPCPKMDPHTNCHQSPATRFSSSRLLRFWTRSNRPHTESPPSSAPPNPCQLPHSRTTDTGLHLAATSSSSAPATARRRSSMPRLSSALCKCLSWRSNRKSLNNPEEACTASSSSRSRPPPATANVAAPRPPLSPPWHAADASPEADALVHADATGPMYCTSTAISSSSSSRHLHRSLAQHQSTADWLARLPATEATVYRARIAMNPMGWYRGAMTREQSQQRLQAKPNGSWLVRDSQTAGCHFTLCFRSAGITLHSRIEHVNGFWGMESLRNVSLVGLLELAQQLSRDQVLCYVRPSSQLQQPFPVRLTQAISKRAEVPRLQHICRFVIRLQMGGELLMVAPGGEDAGEREAGGGDKLAELLPSTLCEYVRDRAYLGRYIGYFET